MNSDSNPYFDAGITAAGSSSSAAAAAGANSVANSNSLAPPAPSTGTSSRPTSSQRRSPSPSQTTSAPSTPLGEQPPPSLARTVFFRPLGPRAQSSIRLRRLSNSAPPQPQGEGGQPSEEAADQPPYAGDHGLLRPLSRLRSGTRSRAGSTALPLSRLPTIEDGVAQDFATGVQPVRTADGNVAPGVVVQGQNGQRVVPVTSKTNRPEYDSQIVDLLDVIDPEVSTLSSITNVQNSLFVPSLGRLVNRRPTYDLSFVGKMPGAFPEVPEERTAEEEEEAAEAAAEAAEERRRRGERAAAGRTYSITSQITPSHYAVLPAGASLEGWDEEDVDRLNDYVRHMLHSRRSKLKRSMRAFGMYARTPLGFFVTLYATLITLFGLAWVLFLIGWIYVGDRQLYAINVIDNVLVALFAVVGDGMAPFRLIDTYHMCWIVHYYRLTWKRRKAHALRELENKNDLPTEAAVPAPPPGDVDGEEARAACEAVPDLEAARQKETAEHQEFSVLSPKQQARLVHHQAKMSKSHTFYKPHETETHHAFPLNLLVVIILLLDLHSCLQICLGSVTWSTDYRHRSTAATTAILCCSITANTTAGVVIAIGDRRTRKKDVIERMMRQELTDHAMRKVEKDRRAREAEEMAARKDVRTVGRFDVDGPALHRVSEEFFRDSGDSSEGLQHFRGSGEKQEGQRLRDDKEVEGEEDSDATNVPGRFPA